MANLYQRAKRVAYASTFNNKDTTPTIQINTPTNGKSRTWPETTNPASVRIPRMGSKLQQRRPSRQSSPLRPAHTKRLPRSAGIDAFASALQESGCVIITDFTSPANVDQANAEIAPYLAQDEVDGAFGVLPKGKTGKVTRLIGRSRTVREEFFEDALFQELCERVLDVTTRDYAGDEATTMTAKPLLSHSTAFGVRPGAEKQGLRRGDGSCHWRHRKVGAWEDDEREMNGGKGKSGVGEGRREGLVGLFVPGTDARAGAGVMRVVPGSHLWGDEKPEFENGDVVDVEMGKGEAMVMLGSVYYGVAEYVERLADVEEGEDESKIVYAMFCCNGVSRQEEVPWLSYNREEMQSWSKVVQERLGMRASAPKLG